MYTFIIAVIIGFIVLQCYNKGESKIFAIACTVVLIGFGVALLNIVAFGFNRNNFNNEMVTKIDTISLSNDSTVYDFLVDKFSKTGLKDTTEISIKKTTDSISTINRTDKVITTSDKWLLTWAYPYLNTKYVINLNEKQYELFRTLKANDK